MVTKCDSTVDQMTFIFAGLLKLATFKFDFIAMMKFQLMLLKLFVICGTQGGRLTSSDNHIDVYCHGGWGNGHYHGIENNTGRPWTSQN